MKILRYVAAAVTTLMSLMNLPFAFGDGVSPPIGWLVPLITALDVACFRFPTARPNPA